jgi:hypothetical protein
MDARSTIFMLRCAAVIVLLAAVAGLIGTLHGLATIGFLDVLAAGASMSIGLGLCAGLLGIAHLLAQKQALAASPAAPSMVQNQLIEVSIKLEEIGRAVDRLPQLLTSPPAVPLDAPAPPPSRGASPEVLAALTRLFEELRELSLLTDEQRRQRGLEMKHQRKAAAVESIQMSIAQRRWSEATAELTALRQEWADDAAVAALPEQLAAAQRVAAEQAVAQAQSQIESDMSLSRWDEAATAAQQLASDYPQSESAAALLARVERERKIFTEATVNRLFEEIRHDVERRFWRRALAHAEQLLSKFPTHPRADQISKQMQTIRENAEIQERQEHEARIGELIRSRRFREAVALSQELLDRFPLSPQAEAIQKLLPRITQLAEEPDDALNPSSI